MYFRFLIRFLLLSVGFALTTAGLLGWQQINFDLASVWPMAETLNGHPVYMLIFGLALIPPTLWEIFLLENREAGEG